MSQIGTVKILIDRNYAREDGTPVNVPIGTYPVFSEDGNVHWLMEGYPCHWQETRFEPLGSGLFAVHPGGFTLDDTTPVSVRSARMPASEFASFVAEDPLCVPGDDQRLEFTLA